MIDLTKQNTSYDNSGRRSNSDRRQFSYTSYIPERRSDVDRRSGKDRRKSLRMQ
jgi:hypothetical protein